jgi:hypothetical protein
MTGRGTFISMHMCSTQLPLPFDEEQFSEPSVISLLENSETRDKRLEMAMTSPHLRQAVSQHTQDALAGRSWLQSLPVTPSLYLLYYCDLTVVNEEILNRLYTPENAMASWEDIKGKIRQMTNTVETWLSTLPPGLDFTSMKDENDQTYWAKTNLAFQYHSTRILLGRPALCRRTTHGKSSHQQGFSNDMAVICLKSAMHMLDLLPDEPNIVHAYQFCPWWCLVHYIMQTATVIIMELSFDCFHMPDRKGDLVQCAEKSVRWLQKMSEHCIASHRAWQLCDIALRRIMSNTGTDANDMPPPDQQRHDVFVDPSSFLSSAIVSAVPNLQNLPYHHQSHSLVPSNEAYIASQHSNCLDITNSLASASLSVPSSQGNSAGDVYFPQDPISGEFISYFFPELTDKDRLPGGTQT